MFVKSKILSDPDDIVMVDRPSPTGVDNDTSFERAAVQRSNTSARKSGFMGLFGIRKPEPESSRAISGDEAYGGSRRKRLAGEAEEGSKRPRRSHRSERLVDDGEGITTDAPATGNNTEVEDPEARREARKARKEDKERQARKNELRDLEERRARRELKSKGATEERKSKIREAMSKAEGAEVVEDLNFIEGEETDKPRRHKSTRETDEERRTRHKPNRKSSHIDGPLPTRTIAEEDERRSYRNSKISSKRDVKDNKQKNAPVTDYFDLRNSKSSSKSNPYAHNTAKGADKTSSWVNSQVLDPPAVPPIEGTVIEQDPILGPDDGERDLDDTPVDEEEERRRRKRTERRRSRADRVLGEEEASRRRRVAENGDGGQRSSEGSEERDYERERRRRAGSTGYGRPTMDKRTSWFKKLGI